MYVRRLQGFDSTKSLVLCHGLGEVLCEAGFDSQRSHQVTMYGERHAETTFWKGSC
jgi:hypothetical protein